MLCSEIAQVTFKPSVRCVILTYVQIPVRDRLELPATDRALILSHVVDKSMFPEPSWALSHICALRTLPHFTLCCSLRTTIRTLCQDLLVPNASRNCLYYSPRRSYRFVWVSAIRPAQSRGRTSTFHSAHFWLL